MADALSEVLKSPGAFALRSLKAFRANQGLLLAGAVAYYALLSIVPLLILVVIALSHLLGRRFLLDTLQRQPRSLFPLQGAAVVAVRPRLTAARGVAGSAVSPTARLV